jgi:AcrR family transcriptional regulator
METLKSNNVSIVLSPRVKMVQTDRIIQGGEELFLKAGIKSVTMDDIARHLGMSKKTIYQFFKDKNELVIGLVEKKLKDDEDQLNAIISQSGNVIEEMINMMKCSEEIFSKINPIVIHDMQKYHPDAWKKFQDFKSGVLISTLERLLTKGISQGYIRPDIDVKIIARMRVHQVELGFNTTIFPVAEFSTWKVQYQFLEHFNYGICTLKGYKLLNKYKNINDD